MRWHTYTELQVCFKRVTLTRGRYAVCAIISLKYLTNTEHRSKMHQAYSIRINSTFYTHVANKQMHNRNM